jgi:hypothetical protein
LKASSATEKEIFKASSATEKERIESKASSATKKESIESRLCYREKEIIERKLC